MSHFSVLVIGENVEQQLAPYHEFECTGINDQYVQRVDKLPEAREAYEGSTATRLRSPHGELFEPYDDRFYRDPTEEEKEKLGPIAGSGFGQGMTWHSKDWGDGKGYRAKIQFIPEGFEEVEVARSKVETFANFVEGYYGMPRLGEIEAPNLNDKHRYGWYRVNATGAVIEVIDRTNPNRQWDWWLIGGRWSGFLKLKATAEGPDRADQALKRDVDIKGMRDDAGREAAKSWDKAHAAAEGEGWLSWDEMRALNNGNMDAARNQYWAQPAVNRVKEALDLLFETPDPFLATRDQYVQQARDKAICSYAVVKDSKWHARGSMGWFGISSDEVEQADWNQRVNALIDSLPGDTLLTVVDCHI